MLITFSVSSFAVVAFWRGLWVFLDFVLFPDHFVLSAVSSLVIGCFMFLCIDLFLRKKQLSINSSRPIWMSIIFLQACCAVFSWRGAWYLLDELFRYIPHDIISSLICLFIGTFVLILTQTLNGAIAPPFLSSKDKEVDSLELKLFF